MDRRNGSFFELLKACTKEKQINMNHITLEQITKGYESYIQKYYNYIEDVDNSKRIDETKKQKIENDKLYQFWVNPFHILLRNSIGETGIPKQKVEQVVTNTGEGATLLQTTVDSIKSRYMEVMEKQVYKINSENFEEEIKNILIGITQKQGQEKKSLLVQIGPEEGQEGKKTNKPVEINRIGRYAFDSSVTGIREGIEEYKITFGDKGIEYGKKIYGNIDLNRFYEDKSYQRVVLEAIEDLEIRNHREHTQDNYIGTFSSMISNGIPIWQQKMSAPEMDAIKKIEELDTMYRKMVEVEKEKLEERE